MGPQTEGNLDLRDVSCSPRSPPPTPQERLEPFLKVQGKPGQREKPQTQGTGEELGGAGARWQEVKGASSLVMAFIFWVKNPVHTLKVRTEV